MIIYIILSYFIHEKEIFQSIIFIFETILGLVSFIIYILNELSIQKIGVRIQYDTLKS